MNLFSFGTIYFVCLPYRMKLTQMYLKAGVGMQILVCICIKDVHLLYRKEPRTAAAFLLNWKRKRYSKIFYEIK